MAVKYQREDQIREFFLHSGNSIVLRADILPLKYLEILCLSYKEYYFLLLFLLCSFIWSV